MKLKNEKFVVFKNKLAYGLLKKRQLGYKQLVLRKLHAWFEDNVDEIMKNNDGCLTKKASARNKKQKSAN